MKWADSSMLATKEANWLLMHVAGSPTNAKTTQAVHVCASQSLNSREALKAMDFLPSGTYIVSPSKVPMGSLKMRNLLGR